MIQPARETTETVPLEEQARRIAEMRQLAFQGKAYAQVVYHPPHQPCPWRECEYRIAGIRFELEQMAGYAAERDRWLAAWWLGPGLLAKCPRCRCWVLFDVLGKLAVADPAQLAVPLPQLPDDWHLKAYLTPQNGR
jgi:hypothetical protein